jgi:hypothetical protein
MSTVPDCILCDLPVHPHRHPETGKVVWTQGHNARPLEGRVCDACHGIVIAVRFGFPLVGYDINNLRILGKAGRAAFDTEASE